MEEFLTLRSRRPDSSADSTYGSASETSPLATHDISRVSYHVKHLESFAEALQDSASRAFPNRGRPSQRYSKVQALMLHWKCDDLFVLPELEDLEKCLREDYRFETETFAIPSENAHLELMLKLGDMVKKHESEDTLFVVYYGGHAKIDESRQSTWCATRNPGSPWLQWSAIQTLLERSVSDVLILLDCCAGAASATFPTGKSITETISASSWDAIAPDPGRYSFTNALIEVLQEWRLRVFSAAMLHAEVLARLKHPRPILINGKHFEARSTPVHFMMTSNYRAPSIELGRVVPEARLPPSPPKELPYRQLPAPSQLPLTPDESISQDSLVPCSTEPNEDQPHVMISLALEEDQRLDINAWEQWLASFPALAKYVKVQGVFKSHSTLLLLSLPVMVWDLLPDDPACSFIAFIRSNNLIKGPETYSGPTATVATRVQVQEQEPIHLDTKPWITGTQFSPVDDSSTLGHGFPPVRPRFIGNQSLTSEAESSGSHNHGLPSSLPIGHSHAGLIQRPIFTPVTRHSSTSLASLHGSIPSTTSPTPAHRPHTTHRPIPAGAEIATPPNEATPRTTVFSQSKSSITTNFAPEQDVPEGPQFAQHVIRRLEKYFLNDPEPNMAQTEVIASNLGVEVSDIDLWFHHRREQERLTHNLQSLRLGGSPAPESHNSSGVQMILPGHLNTLLEIYPSKSVLIVDLRSTTDFEKSHIHDAVNLRAPLMYVENTSLEMIEDTFMDDQSRRNFSKWKQCRCVVFYDRVVEFDWECPAAGALYDKFRRKGWSGHGFVLKGHYKEFSASFDRYISGSKMSKEAKAYLDGLRGQSSLTPEEAERRNQRYETWLRAVMTEDRVPQRVELIPARKLERRRAVENYQKELEAEFESRFPALYRKALSLGKRRSDSPPPPSAREPSPPPPWSDRPFGEQEWGARDDDGTGGGRYGSPAEDAGFSDRKAAFVEPLVSGLENIRGAAAASGYRDGSYGYRDAALAKESGYAAGGSYMAPPADKLDQYAEGFEEVDPNSEGLKDDPMFQKAGTGKYQESSGGGDDGGVKKSGRMANLRNWGRLRSGK